MMQLMRVGVDFVKNPFQVHGVDHKGLAERVAEIDAEGAAIAKDDPAAQRLEHLRGVANGC